MRPVYFLLLATLVLAGCGSKYNNQNDPDHVTIGTFNIAWLGDGDKDQVPRKEEDYKRIANIITETGCDVIALQEIENIEALRKLLMFLPDFSFYMAKSRGKQNVGVLFRNDIYVDYIGEYMPLVIEEGRNRPGMILKAKKGNFDWLMMIVHLKSTSRYDETQEEKTESRETRRLQADAISKWIDSVSIGSEKDIIIAGDFNDNPGRKRNSLQTLVNNRSVHFITKDLKSCKFKFLNTIDHIIVSTPVMKRFLKNSTRMYDFYSALPKDEAEGVSDHCPVSARFNAKIPDND